MCQPYPSIVVPHLPPESTPPAFFLWDENFNNSHTAITHAHTADIRKTYTAKYGNEPTTPVDDIVWKLQLERTREGTIHWVIDTAPTIADHRLSMPDAVDARAYKILDGFRKPGNLARYLVFADQPSAAYLLDILGLPTTVKDDSGTEIYYRDLAAPQTATTRRYLRLDSPDLDTTPANVRNQYDTKTALHFAELALKEAPDNV
ncbi:MAG: hypothetical protein RQ731_08005 [Anaerosomatales bacterium]|nr:hypothetical protein [Anaerosomatales bacterium]